MSVIWQVSPNGLVEEFYHDVDVLLTNSPYVWAVTEAVRSVERSNILYAAYLKGGPRAAPGGKSPHNLGEAVDVVHDGSPNPGVQMDWDASKGAWQWLFDAVKRHPRLHSGTSFGDAPHIESVAFARHHGRLADGTYFMPMERLKYKIPVTPHLV